MILDDIRDYHETRPFVPFEIRQSDGGRYVIENSEWMLITPDQTTIHFVTRDGRSRHLAMHQITSVAQAPPPKRTKSKTNGRR